MDRKRAVKHGIDAVMLLLLPLLMAEVLTGQELHEWMGTAMAVLFLAHHILNLGWYRGLPKGQYGPARALWTALDLLLTADMLALAASGIAMSGFVFPFLPFDGGMVLARRLHLFASHWGLILMSAHLGLHWDTVMTMGRKLCSGKEKSPAGTWALRGLTLLGAAWGVYAFFRQTMPSYLFLRSAFVLFDEQKPAPLHFAEYVAMVVLFAAVGHYLNNLVKGSKAKGTSWKAAAILCPLALCAVAAIALTTGGGAQLQWAQGPEPTQREYRETMGENLSTFSGDDLPVENISWLDAIAYCNARSEAEGLTPAYTVQGENVAWDRAADGYRLPTEAEWEYACRAGTVTPFNTETSISPEESNYYGHYPYQIEENYFSQGNLTTKPGEYRQTTVAVDSFAPNPWGLYNMHGKAIILLALCAQKTAPHL